MEENKGIPQIRFPEFLGEWELQKIGYLFSNRKQRGNINLPIFSVTQDQGLILRSLLDRKMEDSANPTDNLTIEPNDIVYNMMRMWQGAYGQATVKGMVSPAYVVLKPNNNVNSLFFIYHFGRSKSKYLFTAYSHGLTSDRLRLYYKDFSGIKFYYPCYAEQTRIANFLTGIDKRNSLLKQKKNLLERYKKGIMQKLFSQELRFKDDNGNEFPNWELINGGELFKSISNKDHNSDLPILAISQELGAVPRELINFQISVTDKSVVGYKVVEIGDFIISLRSFQGGIEFSNYKGICSPAYIILRNTEPINKTFFKYFFKTDFYIQQLCQKLEGIRDGKMVSYKYFSEIGLPYPSVAEQTCIANFVSSIDEKINLTENQIQQTQQYKMCLLQNMFI